MSKLNSNLYITFSNQKVRDLKETKSINALDNIITLDNLILELFQKNSFKLQIDYEVISSIIYKIIKKEKIEYFSYLNEESNSLNTISSFILKCTRNNIDFNTFHKGEKLEALNLIYSEYKKFKMSNNLVDIADIEEKVLNDFDESNFSIYNEVYIDSFKLENISFIKSLKQEKILDKLKSKFIELKRKDDSSLIKLISPKDKVFDNIDEVKTAIKITRKLLEEGCQTKDIIILASDISEYATIYKLFLDEYEIKGFTSIGISINSFFNTKNEKVIIALKQYNSQIKDLEELYKHIGLTLSQKTKDNIKSSIKILDDKIGIELSEANQLVGLSKKYKHIIFLGTDINHFPPKTSDNFLYSYDNDVEYFYANNYFTSSQTQINELKRLADNLYIITASYSGKRELFPSILIDKTFDEIIDLSSIKSLSELSLNKQTQIPNDNTKEYYESIKKNTFTKYDGLDVEGIKCDHLSASQINKYLACPLSYLYSNKIKVQAPAHEQEGFDVREQGSLMHLCYELFARKIKDDKILSSNKDELFALMFEISLIAYMHQETFDDQIKENIHHKLFLRSLQSGLKDEKELGLLAKFVNYYILNAKEFNYFKTSEFEKEFVLDKDFKPYKLKDEYDKNYFIKGFIDRFDNLDQTIQIIDYKSTKATGINKEKQEEIDSLKDVQLALYILYAKQEYKNKTYDSSLLSFKGNDKGVHFSSLSTSDVYTQEYENKLKNVINSTKDNINNGMFAFNNVDEKTCGYCDIKNMCHESLLNKTGD